MAIGTQYTKFVAKTASYTITVSDDVITFTTAAAGVIATLPLAATCTIPSGQNIKLITSASGSTDPITIAVQSGNTLVGITETGAAQTLAAGESAFCIGNGSTVWTISGGDAAQGTSGYSGFSGWSGFSGASGYSGFSGVSGYSGYSGVSGYSGKSGYSGFSGVSGYSGFSGISGYSGFSGFSGFTGV